jgi:hypothetical protein
MRAVNSIKALFSEIISRKRQLERWLRFSSYAFQIKYAEIWKFEAAGIERHDDLSAIGDLTGRYGTVPYRR